MVGSRLENYCDQLGVSRAEGPFAHATAMRHVLAYKDPARIDDDTVHETCSRDAPELAREIDSALAALS